MSFILYKKGLNSRDFQKLFETYFEQIKRYVYYKSGDEECASDIAQEVFMKVWEQRKTIKEETVKSLLYTMAERLFIDKWRKQTVAIKFKQKQPLNAFDEMTPSDYCIYEETKRIYENILLEMPEKSRVVFLMSRMEGLKYREIAERLQINIKTVEKRMSKALTMLKAELGNLH